MIIFKHIKNDDRSPHLFDNTKATPRGTNEERCFESLAPHVVVHRISPNIDHRNIRHSGALPFCRVQTQPDSQCTKGIKANDVSLAFRCGSPSRDKAVFDVN